ncbi:putative transcriptional regulatory protein [wastewater metagenome]|uniref:Putative transcriptional regulatory protein n=2 Tax=unclassified sequences TaxID=12908 RepID=A0A5B8RBX6_9ZZZZ|nr:MULTISPECIES: YebC/PmpR family DNA-binding transcriptional regulator [Arhodomonas]MCS4504178.1 YebC/PmpR family DNA-binding transcriptional regulator [Arhodomonas aquaeolei]QEA04892.1 putative transcriptional regulatory protein [uncultured organism]
MAGHSKWANIQHRKKAQDAKRGKLFTKAIREINVATRMGGPDPETNPRLRLAMDRALAVNMPKDNIERAIKKASGDDDSANYEEPRFEGYGPGGVAIMVDCMTDNRNRTVSEVRHAFSKHGGNLGTDGCVAFLFTQRGVLLFPPDSDEERIMEVALEAGADDIVTNEDGSIEVLTAPESYHATKDALLAADLEPADSEVTMRPETTVEVGDEDGRKTLRLIERLEDLDDTQNVYTNADIQPSAYEEG